MRRSLLTLVMSSALVGATGLPAFAADPSTSPPPPPTTGTPEVQFVGAAASAAQPVDDQSLVSVVVTQRADDIYNVAESFNNANTQTPCTGCRSVAAALQIVLVPGHPSSLSPVNGAYAFNYQCTSCLSYAYANQKLVYVPAHFRVPERLREQVAEISDRVAYQVRHDATAASLQQDMSADFAALDAAVARAVNGQHEDNQD